MSRNVIDAIINHVKAKADIVKVVNVRYMGNGFWLGKRAGCDQGLLMRGQGSSSYAPGMSLNVGADYGGPNKAIITLPPMGRIGASSLPYNTMDPASYDGIACYRAIPNTVPRGSTNYAVSLIGSGFAETPVDSVEAVVFNELTMDWETDPLVTIDSVTWVSSTQLDITLDVSSTAMPEYQPIFRISRT